MNPGEYVFLPVQDYDVLRKERVGKAEKLLSPFIRHCVVMVIDYVCPAQISFDG